MNSDIIISLVVCIVIAGLIALYYKTFIVDGAGPHEKMAATDGAGRSPRQRLNESEASAKKGFIP